MIDPARALRDVRAGLRTSVLPALDSAHARATLAAALGIIDSVIPRIRPDPVAAEATVAAFLPAAEEWERTLATDAPGAAELIAAELARARAADDPFSARAALLGAAAHAVEAAWEKLEPAPREEILASVRRAARADIEAQMGQ